MGTTICKEHPRYQAKRKPRASCESCWRQYIAAVDFNAITNRTAHVAWLKILGNCKHPSTRAVTGEHDNGYGRQTKRDGLVCNDCGRMNYWPPAGSWV